MFSESKLKSGAQKKKEKKRERDECAAKLKVIKSYLRSSMGQDRLSGLPRLSVENSRASDLDLSSVVNDFAKHRAHRMNF